MRVEPRAVIVTGVAGAGKTTLARALAARLGWRFVDADDHHPPENVAKMARGEALDDTDRRPWLERLHALLADELARGGALVLACSALKRRYRDTLRRGHADRVLLVHLTGDPDRIAERMRARRAHYFPPELLASQLAALEPPAADEHAVRLDLDRPLPELVEAVLRETGLEGKETA